MESTGEIQIGTCGWSHNDWRGPFYPRDLKRKQQLPFYSDHFSTAEISNTFKNFPFKKDIKRYNNDVNEEFSFSVCGNRRITHQSGLKDLRGVMNAFFERLEGLDKMDIVVWEIPEKVDRDVEMLTEFLEVLPMQYRHVLEFKDEAWHDGEVLELIEGRDLACVSRFCQETGEEEVFDDGPFVYWRLRGSENGGEGLSIQEDKLQRYADTAREWAEDGKDVYMYFLNTGGGKAVQDAQKLEEMLA